MPQNGRLFPLPEAGIAGTIASQLRMRQLWQQNNVPADGPDALGLPDRVPGRLKANLRGSHMNRDVIASQATGDTRVTRCQRTTLREALLWGLVFFIVVTSGCAERQPQDSASGRTMVDGPLSVTLEQVGLSKNFDPDANDPAQLEVWCLLERTDGVAISDQNNVTLGGLSVMRADGQRIRHGMVFQTAYQGDNVPVEFYWRRGKRPTLKDNQRLLHHRVLFETSDILKMSQFSIELRLGLTGQDEELRSFVFKNVLVR